MLIRKIGLFLLSCYFLTAATAQNSLIGNKTDSFVPSCIDIPSSITFCGSTIDLTEYDHREALDRELLAFKYMHSTSLQIIKKANRYFPVVIPILKQQGIPEDFVYLMVIESSLNPRAHSAAGAKGFWQLMPNTARELGLVVNSEIDERMHLQKSTEAACTYLKKAYQRFGNWEAVAASYNAGQYRISSLMSQQNVDDTLDLHMVEETTRYIYRILAAKYMLQEPCRFDFHLRASDLYPPLQYKTITVNRPVNDWASFASEQGVSYADLRKINPWIIDKQLKNKENRQYEVQIPSNEWMHYNPLVTPVYNPHWICTGRQGLH